MDPRRSRDASKATIELVPTRWVPDWSRRRVRRNPNVVTGEDLRRGFLDIEIDFDGGFFAQINWCLFVFAFAERHSLEARITLVGENYRVDPARRDWLPEFFVWRRPFPVTEAESEFHRKHVTNFDELGFTITPEPTLAEAHTLFFARLAVAPDVLAEVDAFVADTFGGRVLGIHYRGTDKYREAEPVSYEAMRANAAELMATGDFEAVFVTSDEAGFVTFMEESFPHARVISRPNDERSSDWKAIHLDRSAGYSLIGYEALCNALLLSRCDMLLRTTSFLSAWSAIFSPAIQIRTLNAPREKMLWYPEREIMRSAAASPLSQRSAPNPSGSPVPSHPQSAASPLTGYPESRPPLETLD